MSYFLIFGNLHYIYYLISFLVRHKTGAADPWRKIVSIALLLLYLSWLCFYGLLLLEFYCWEPFLYNSILIHVLNFFDQLYMVHILLTIWNRISKPTYQIICIIFATTPPTPQYLLRESLYRAVSFPHFKIMGYTWSLFISSWSGP